MLTGNIFLSQVIFGGGSPVASHINCVLCPTSTTLLVIGEPVICGNPGGSLSAGTRKMSIIHLPESPQHKQVSCTDSGRFQNDTLYIGVNSPKTTDGFPWIPVSPGINYGFMFESIGFWWFVLSPLLHGTVYIISTKYVGV